MKSCDIGLSTVIVKKKLLKKNLFCNLQTKEDFYLTINKKDIRNYKVILKYNGPIVAPVQKDKKIADLIVSNKGLDLLYIRIK